MKKQNHRTSRSDGLSLWRGQDSNLRPLGYEPNELPLLHPAMFYECKVKAIFSYLQINLHKLTLLTLALLRFSFLIFFADPKIILTFAPSISKVCFPAEYSVAPLVDAAVRQKELQIGRPPHLASPHAPLSALTTALLLCARAVVFFLYLNHITTQLNTICPVPYDSKQ